MNENIRDLLYHSGEGTNDRMIRNAAGRVVGWQTANKMSILECCELIDKQGWKWQTVLRINS